MTYLNKQSTAAKRQVIGAVAHRLLNAAEIYNRLIEKVNMSEVRARIRRLLRTVKCLIDIAKYRESWDKWDESTELCRWRHHSRIALHPFPVKWHVATAPKFSISASGKNCGGVSLGLPDCIRLRNYNTTDTGKL